MGGGGRSREQTSDDVVEVVGEEMRGGGRSTGKRVTMWWRWSGKRWGAEGGQGVIMWWRRWSGLFGVEGRNRLDFVFFVTMVSCETTHFGVAASSPQQHFLSLSVCRITADKKNLVANRAGSCFRSKKLLRGRRQS